MPTVTQGAIHCELARPRLKDLDNIANHDGSMRAGGRPPAGNNFVEIGRIPLRRMLFVFLRKVTRVLPSISPAPLWSFCIHNKCSEASEAGARFLGFAHKVGTRAKLSSSDEEGWREAPGWC